MKTTTKKLQSRKVGVHSREAERLERLYRECGFEPTKDVRDALRMGKGFVFTPPSFLPDVKYTVTTLTGA